MNQGEERLNDGTKNLAENSGEERELLFSIWVTL